MDFLDRIPKKKQNLAWRIIDGNAVVIPLEDQPADGEKMYVFNDTATKIWKAADGKNCVGEIIKKLLVEYEVKPETAEFQAKQLMDDFIKKELVAF